jgi:hypothetical protein
LAAVVVVRERVLVVRRMVVVVAVLEIIVTRMVVLDYSRVLRAVDLGTMVVIIS